MSYRKTVLIVDDEEFIRVTLKRVFMEENYRVLVATTGGEALGIIEQEEVDLALLDISLPDMNGIEVLEKMKQVRPDLLVIIATGYASVESAIRAIKLGAYDYIKKPFKADAIKLIARLALETTSLKETVRRLKHEQQGGIDRIIGESEPIAHIKHQITEFSRYDAETVLITGESGSGKEMVAEALHAMSPRADGDFIEINCASIPENLLESELFGHERGAFTDAKTSKIGLFERAENGTVFLDEIGELTQGLQAKLLRVLENKKLRRLGSTEDIEIDIRIIAATNRNLKEAIADKSFRQDLYYRLNVLRIEMPPLRDRGADIVALAQYFMHQFNRRFNKTVKDFSPAAQEILLQYAWPGNVRELKNTVERICILQKEEIVDAHHLPAELLSDQLQETLLVTDGDMSALEGSFDEIIARTEITLLTRAYLLSGKNTSKASRLLKMPRETLRYKLAKYKIGDGEN